MLLDGYKTYIAGILLIATAIAIYLTNGDLEQATILFANGLGFIGLRAAKK